MAVKCIIVDDEPLAIEVISDYLRKLDGFRIVACCSDAIEAFTKVKQLKPDLIFLDIEMPELSGLDFIKTLKNAPSIILTTAYREYAVDAFDMDVMDYLLKPISFDRFMRAIDRFLEVFHNKRSNTEMFRLSDQKYLSVYADGRTYQVDLEKIMYFESLGDYIKIYLKDDKLVTRESLTSICQKLPEQIFIRIHRSYIVSISKIDSYSKSSIRIGEMELPVSRKYKESVQKYLKGKF